MQDEGSRKDAGARKKVLLIGWDAADWRVAEPLMEAGEMPNLRSLVETGVMGNLATLSPVLSPMLWTSIATGKRPFKHGIYGFTEPDPSGAGVRPVTNLGRKTKALWNILHQNGYRSNVIGWWPSHPAEPIAGAMVSNRYQRAHAPLDQPWPMLPGTVHPVRLAETLAGLRVHPGELTAEHILPFVPKLAEVEQDKDRRLESIAKVIADCATIQAAATYLMHAEPWDVTAVYFDAIDHFCHGFMRYHPPRPEWVDEQGFELYKDVVRAGYRFHDMMLGTLLYLAGEDATVILVSDHGFHPDHLRPERIPREPAGPAAEHRSLGIFAMRGPGVAVDQRIHGASLLDVTPTILYLLGLPVGRDMDGKPLVDAFERPEEVRSIPSWDEAPGDAGLHPPELQVDPVESREALDQLVALGYIDQPEEDVEQATEQSIRELRYNEACAYLDAFHYRQAADILAELYHRWPDQHRFGMRLAGCYKALGDIEELVALVEVLRERRLAEAGRARETLRALKAEREAEDAAKPLDEAEQRRLRELRAAATPSLPGLEFMAGYAAYGQGRFEVALNHFDKALAGERNNLALHNQIGEVCLEMERYEQAENSFLAALALDAENHVALLGLTLTCLAQRRDREAAGHALDAVGLIYHNPRAHYALGVALLRLGKVRRAAEALRVAVAQQPAYLDAHDRLADLYEKRLEDPEAALRHRDVAAEIRRRQGDRARQAIPEPGPEGDARREARPVAAGPPAPSVVSPFAPGDVVTVVTGLPRSGTSLLMQMMQAGGLPVLTDGQRAADVDNPKGYFELDRVKSLRKDASWVAEAKGKAIKVIPQLLSFLPRGIEYQVVFIERDLAEVVASQGDMLGRLGERGAELDAERLQRVYGRQVAQAKALLQRRDGMAVCFVRHRSLVESPEQTAQAINAFFRGRLDGPAMARVVDPTLYRRRSA